MAHNEGLMELDALGEQFGYINEKLDKQSLIRRWKPSGISKDEHPTVVKHK